MLTDTKVKALKAKEKLYRVADTAGLCVEVRPNGAKLWRLRYRWLGRAQMIGLGPYPEVSLAEARERREEARKQLAHEVNPSEKRRTDRAAKIAAGRDTFEAVAIEWLAKMQGKWTDHHAEDVRRSLLAEAFPSIGRRPVRDLTPTDVIACLRKIEDRGAIEVAHRTAQRISSVCRYAVQTGRATMNPASDLRDVLKTRDVRPQPAMPLDEMGDFLLNLDAYEGDPGTKLGLRLIVLTALRTGELRGGRWNEIDFAEGVWRVPSERMKIKKRNGIPTPPHVVPLSKQASEVLQELRRLNVSNDPAALMFPARSSLRTPISENTLLFAMYRMGYHGRATVHGFRSVFSSWANESSGAHPDAIERQLAHIEGNAVRAAYDRSQHLIARVELMQKWADALDAMRNEALGKPKARKAA